MNYFLFNFFIHFLYQVYWHAAPADQPQYNVNDNNINNKQVKASNLNF